MGDVIKLQSRAPDAWLCERASRRMARLEELAWTLQPGCAARLEIGDSCPGSRSRAGADQGRCVMAGKQQERSSSTPARTA